MRLKVPRTIRNARAAIAEMAVCCYGRPLVTLSQFHQPHVEAYLVFCDAPYQDQAP